MINKYCQHPINGTETCRFHGAIKVTRANPVDPSLQPKYICYSHLMSFIKHSTGQFLIERATKR